MAHNKEKVTSVLAYVPHSMKERMDAIKERDRHYTQTRLIEEALAAFVPAIEQQLGIKPAKVSRLREA